MGKEKFEEFIKQSDTQNEQINWEEKKQWFIKQVDEFYNIIDEYLEPYKDKIEIKDCEITIYEEKLGSYEIKKRSLNIKNNIVEFIPVGAILIGAWGRIDMEGPNGKVKFVLVPEFSKAPKIETAILSTDEDRKKWEEKQRREAEMIKNAKKVWKIATQPPSIEYLDLDENRFFDKLMEVING
jgi:hypothetical protein